MVKFETLTQEGFELLYVAVVEAYCEQQAVVSFQRSVYAIFLRMQQRGL